MFDFGILDMNGIDTALLHTTVMYLIISKSITQKKLFAVFESHHY